MAPSHKLKLLEHSNVSPPPGLVPSTSLPLTFFDLPWLLFPPTQPLFFYPFPHPTSHFTATVLPNLKHSLSFSLQHFFPFAGNLFAPPPPAKPLLVYTDGDSVSLTVAESTADFDHLSGNHPRPTTEFHPLVPSLPPLSRDIDTHKFLFPLLAVKVTVFPNSGVCVGFAYRDVAADERTFDHFLKFWMSVSRFGRGLDDLVPMHDRCLIGDPNKLQHVFLRQWWELKSFSRIGTASDTVRATFVVGRADMEKIKRLILSNQAQSSSSSSMLLSPYVVTCALLWECLVKVRRAVLDTENVQDINGPYYFGFIAGGIHRLDYPVPTNYFGNCVAFGCATASKGELMGENGLFVAAKAIGDKVKELNGSVLGGAEEWISTWNGLFGSDHHVMVSGSPKVDLYGLDFGWGRPNKIEDISIDGTGAVSLAESRYLEGGIEIGLSLPRGIMEIFTSLFTKCLQVSH